MPNRAPSMCRAPGCAALIDTGRYCAAHAHLAGASRRDYDATTRKADPALLEAARIRNTARWKRIAAMGRQQWPVCADPFKGGCQRPTAVINHIVPLRVAPQLAYHDSNHAPLCSGCDARIGQMERRGEDTASLFADWRRRYVIERVRISG